MKNRFAITWIIACISLILLLSNCVLESPQLDKNGAQRNSSDEEYDKDELSETDFCPETALNVSGVDLI